MAADVANTLDLAELGRVTTAAAGSDLDLQSLGAKLSSLGA